MVVFPLAGIAGADRVPVVAEMERSAIVAGARLSTAERSACVFVSQT
jgi:hypothetical protein